MNPPLKRRDLLVLVGGLSALSGCSSLQTAGTRGKWNGNDEFPDDDSRNRICEIRTPQERSEEIGSGGLNTPYQPFVYGIQGRENMHGTNQHTKITVDSNESVNVYVTADPDPANNHTTSLADSQTKDDALGEDPLGFDPIQEYTALSTNHFEKILQIPDPETYYLVVTPASVDAVKPDSTIEFTYTTECSYYLPFDEYQELHN